jgi:hypothetical protein
MYPVSAVLTYDEKFATKEKDIRSPIEKISW